MTWRIAADLHRFNAVMAFWEAGARPRVRHGARYPSGMTRWLEKQLDRING